MQPSTVLLIASLGAILILLMLYVYIFMFERKLFLVLWFIGWMVIAINYSLDAFLPDLLRQNRLVLLTSLSSYFYANLLIAYGVFSFLKIKVRKPLFWGAAIFWLSGFIVFLRLNGSDLCLIDYTNVAIFALTFWVGAAMIKSVKKYGKLVLFLGALNIAWVCNTILFSYILKMPQLAPYFVSHIILLANAVGLIQLFFRQQKDEIKRGLAHITYLIHHDELTGLYNKTYFDNKIQELSRNNNCLPVSVIIGDMNGLKFINDVFGHHEGDQWIKRMAHIMRQVCREDDIISRWGGDEFAVILPCTDAKDALAIADKIKAACRNNQEKDILFSISLGVATQSSERADLTEVVKEAEKLMYEMKLVEGKKARWAIAEILGKLLQKAGYETKEHLERLEVLAREYARVLHFSKENLNSLIQAVNFHDIGIIGIPEESVRNESCLDETEWTVLKKHTEIGYHMAHASREFAHLADVILYHHEWWNGQGFPQGLKGEEIPLLSRILAILLAFDDMIYSKPYKPAQTMDDVLDELRRQAGIRLDPGLTALFIKMIQTNAHMNKHNYGDN